MIQDVDKPGSEITLYIEDLSNLLNQHLSDISNLESRIHSFKSKLKDEHRLSKICLNNNNENQDYDVDLSNKYSGQSTAGYSDEPRARAPRVQSGYEYPGGRASNYNP